MSDINHELNSVIKRIFKSISEISYYIRKSDPINMAMILGTDNSSGDKIKEIDYETNKIICFFNLFCPFYISIMFIFMKFTN